MLEGWLILQALNRNRSSQKGEGSSEATGWPRPTLIHLRHLSEPTKIHQTDLNWEDQTGNVEGIYPSALLGFTYCAGPFPRSPPPTLFQVYSPIPVTLLSEPSSHVILPRMVPFVMGILCGRSILLEWPAKVGATSTFTCHMFQKAFDGGQTVLAMFLTLWTAI